MNNLFISYDLISPGQRYDSVAAAIKALGNWAKIHKSYWYVKSRLSAEEAVRRVWANMDRNDSLLVVDASNRLASWQNIDPEVARHLLREWAK